MIINFRLPQGSHHLVLNLVDPLISLLLSLALLVDLVLDQLNTFLHASCLRCHVLQLTLQSGGLGLGDAYSAAPRAPLIGGNAVHKISRDGQKGLRLPYSIIHARWRGVSAVKDFVIRSNAGQQEEEELLGGAFFDDHAAGGALALHVLPVGGTTKYRSNDFRRQGAFVGRGYTISYRSLEGLG